MTIDDLLAWARSLPPHEHIYERTLPGVDGVTCIECFECLVDESLWTSAFMGICTPNEIRAHSGQ